jgi:hypothetical protein
MRTVRKRCLFGKAADKPCPWTVRELVPPSYSGGGFHRDKMLRSIGENWDALVCIAMLIALLTGGLLVRIQPEEPIFSMDRPV